MVVSWFLLLFAYLLDWLPFLFYGAFFFIAFTSYAGRMQDEKASFQYMVRRLAGGAIIFIALYAFFLTVGQYIAWMRGGDFSRILLQQPLHKETPFPQFLKNSWIFQSHLGYFLFYSYGRYWLRAILTIGAAFLFYFFLRLLRRHRHRFFEDGETELGLLLALIVGWPQVVIFVPLIFFFVVIISFIRLLLFRAHYTTLGYPFFVSALVTRLFGSNLISLLEL